MRGTVAAALPLSASDTVLDIGCGVGYYLGTLAQAAGCAGSGVDLSVAAIDTAARRYPSCLWVVANADRFLPYANHSCSAAICITARMNAPEIHRVLQPGGRLLVAIPAPDDLIELRGTGRDRIARTQAMFATDFAFAGHSRATASAELDQQAVEDVLHAIYRPLQPQAPQVQRVTFSLDLLLFHSL
ncbi:MAG: methyltransferase domain-containing protein [Bryobacterales bacterium]|nr:methyltransferase domain-containing protein [Bryobacterales bacterium]